MFSVLNLEGSFWAQCVPEIVQVDTRSLADSVRVVSAEGAQTRADNQVLTVCVMVN